MSKASAKQKFEPYALAATLAVSLIGAAVWTYAVKPRLDPVFNKEGNTQ